MNLQRDLILFITIDFTSLVAGLNLSKISRQQYGQPYVGDFAARLEIVKQRFVAFDIS